MATNLTTIFSKILKTLRENSNNVKEKREALTYISSQAKKLESSGVIKEERYKELCKLVIEAFSKEGGNMQYEALGALTAIVQEFQAHSLHLFESMLQTDKRIRLKILKLLEVVEDNAISAAANDGQILNFFEDCLVSVHPSSMEWITSTACTDNLQMLTKVEHHVLSDQQKLEEDTVTYSLTLLRRLYKLAAVTFDQNVEKFDTLLVDKIVTLAYMGHKRQRGSALKVLQQAIASNSPCRIQKEHPELWAQYKTNLQSMYCKRMLLLVGTCETDWSIQWNITIQLLGTDLHRGANLINNLLSVEEKAFKSTDTLIRRQAFLSWKLLIDNFALDYQELATARRIKLLCIPLNAKNSKTELIALTKLEVWWHLIIKLYKDIAQFANPVITQFLNFCFGPLGDTPLLSSNFNVVASPGKRFLKTKLVAVDALYQLIVPKEEKSLVYASMLEERLPHAVSHAVFQECSKSIIHSIGEALLILGQLVDQEMRNRYQFGKILWTSLMTYIRDIELEQKDHLYRDIILFVTELVNHFDKLMVKNIIFNVILPDLIQIMKTTEFNDNAILELVLKLLSLPILLSESFNSRYIECLLQKCISSEITCSPNVFGFLQTIMSNLRLASNTHKNMIHCVELWAIISKILTKYIKNSKKIDEGDKNGHNFKTVKSILSFPFEHTFLMDSEQIQDKAEIWKTLYKEFEVLAGSINTVKPNEILLDIASMMRTNLDVNCCSFIVICLDALANTIDYKYLLAQNGIPSIVQLIVDAATIALNNLQGSNCEVTLKTLSAILITVYGHNAQKVILYLHACKSVIELALKSQLKTLYKEVASTWEIIISIFKGLDKQSHRELFSLYKETFLTAVRHPNSNVQSLTRSIFEIKDGSDNITKSILDEIEILVEKSPSYSKRDSIVKKKEETGKAKEVRGSFLNRKSVDTKSVSNKLLERDEKKTLILPEPDSQDYVYIKTDLRFDINRLTEHQKETLKKKREDIPALYNDLSQSSSQNSQNLQEWFDIKAKHINESDKANNKKSDLITQKPINNDANKENKIIMQSELNLMDKVINNNNSSKLEENVEDNVVDTNQKKDSTKEAEKKDYDSHDESTLKQNILSSPLFTGFDVILETDENTNITHSTSVAKRLNFESKEEFPEETYERQSSPSMLDSVKRRHRSDKIDSTRSNSSLKSDETKEGQKDSSIAQKTSKTKDNLINNNPAKLGTSSSEKPCDDIDIKGDSMENKKSIKRKYVSDTESDGVVQQRRKRKMISSSKDVNDDDKDKPQDSDNASLDTIDSDGLTQRMRNEMSRLKIDMVFDCSAVNRRRAKQSDEGDKETTSKKTLTFDEKNLKLKFLEAKSAEVHKKSIQTTAKNTKDTKDGKEGNDTNQGANQPKRRGRRSTKQEFDRNDSDVTKEVKKSNDTVDKIHPLKNSVDTDKTRVVPTTSQAAQDADRIQEEKLDKDDSKFISNKKEESSKVPESIEPSQDEIDVVESSQTPNVNIKLDKKCGEKQCFIKIDKMTNIHPAKTCDMIATEKNCVPESIPVDCDDNDVPDPCEQSNEANIDNNKETSEIGNKDSTSKDVIQETDSSNTKVAEGQKTVDNSSTKPTSVTSFSSPKGSGKYSKLKSFTAHGRAAHMLGLVTKQSRVETDSPTADDDSASIKKSRVKDVETETSASKKISTVKEIDKIGGPSGSRQEKIFNNMRSSDYCSSPSTYMFTNLKNDGEKLSSKIDRSMSDSVSMDSTVDKESEENMSLSCEKDDLPILEWSSANPPSLTASPSASILKRNRSVIPEPDPDSITPNKRKRVSFADPPVSREMGYEISATESPHKSNKSMTRNLTPKKDSPFRSKQYKFKMISTDAEKSTENDIPSESNTEGVLQADKANESLMKPSEACSDSAGADEQTFSNSSEKNSVVGLDVDENCEHEVEVTADVLSVCAEENQNEDKQFLSCELARDTAPMNCVETGDTETQQDIFDGSDTKNDSSIIQTSIDEVNTSSRNSSVDSMKLNVTDDSVINALSIKEQDLDDTVDIQNMIGMNSTVNTDEIFCGKLARTSTSVNAKNMAEQDTLPVTDSIFASLPSSQDSRCENNVELDPGFLDSIQPIYPTLSSCREPIDIIVERLTTPFWKQSLQSYFTNRNLFTIGDLAQLSEREVNRMPLKGKPKIEFVRKVLRCYESTCGVAYHKESVSTLACSSRTKLSNKSEQLITATTSDQTLYRPKRVVVIPDSVSAPIDNESLSCSTPLERSAEKLHDNSSTEKSLAEHLDKTSTINSDVNILSDRGNSDLSPLDVSAVNEKTSAEAMVVAHSSFGKSTNHGKSAVLPIATSSISKNLETEASSSSDNINVSSIICDEPFITHSSIGVGTDEMLMTSKPEVHKTTRSVESQMELEDLLDEIDVNVILESAVRRCNAETILSQYKMKMGHLTEQELVKETVRMLGLQNKRQVNDALLKSICHAYGINHVLLRLPDIFNSEQHFFEKVFKAYHKKLNLAECLDVFDPALLKNAIFQKSTSTELVEMLSDKLKQEEREGIRKPIPEVWSLNAMLKRLPTDVIISHTVANEELIPASVVLDIALQNNSSEDIVRALSQSPSRVKRVVDQLCPPQTSATRIENEDLSKECLFNIFKSVCSKLTAQELLDVYHEVMTSKLNVKERKN